MAGDAEDGDGERVRLFIGQVPYSMAEEEILAVDRVAARANDAAVIRYCAAWHNVLGLVFGRRGVHGNLERRGVLGLVSGRRGGLGGGGPRGSGFLGAERRRWRPRHSLRRPLCPRLPSAPTDGDAAAHMGNKRGNDLHSARNGNTRPRFRRDNSSPS
uniref:RRM domain-containing protein n=1 Tax=Oryza barthii TaxID=65489 RepID=A0A0D3HCW2_9ORYZ